MRKQLMTMLEERNEEMINIRRYLHQYPELSFEEANTANFIAEFYEGKDVDIERNVGNGFGIVVTIKGENPGNTIALRADFDALAIKEETDVPFKSKNDGVMHACGHDGHTAYLMVLADCLIQLKSSLSGTIKIIHQHAEEMPPGGAKSILDSGILDDVDHIFGTHLMPVDSAGTVGFNSGYSMAGMSRFVLGIQGNGGHGSSPHLANDPIVAGAHFVTAIQTIISRRLNPFDVGVVTVGSFDGKGARNVIKDRIELEGDARYMSVEARQIIETEMHRIVKGIEIEFGVTCDFTFTNNYPPLYNHPEITEFVKSSIEKMDDQDIKQVIEFPKFSGSEDFSYYLEKIPGTFFFIGCKPKVVEKAYFNHHPKFDIDEDSLLVAAKSVGQVVCSYFQQSHHSELEKTV
jgi:amidohydrolase